MKTGFRQTMAWLHTWSGLVVGWVLYFVFVTGTIGYFYVEIDRWMRPERPRGTGAMTAPAFLGRAEDYLRWAAPGADRWTIHLPGARPEGANFSDLRWRQAATGAEGRVSDHRLWFDAHGDGFRDVQARRTGGGHLLYRMHWQLHYVPRSTGPLVVGACSMVMLVALVSGVITHKKIFVELFTFRSGKGQRSWLDAHTAAGVLALPFFVMITYSGLVFFAGTYIPIAGVMSPGGEGRSVEERAARAGRNAPLLPLERFLAAAATHWGADRVRTIEVLYPGDANAEVHLVHNSKGTLLRDVGEELHFGGVDGRLIREHTARRSAARRVQSTLFGLHEGLFADPVLRWLYFLSGLMGCVMIASGLVFWTVKRRAQTARGGWGFGCRLVEHLNVGTIAGLPVGIAAYFWANRLLPVDLATRADWEAHGLFTAWGLMLVYPALRPPRRAWVEELWIAGGAFALLPLVNAGTTNAHLGVTIPAGDWVMAGFDLTALGIGVLFAAIALTVHRRPSKLEAVGHASALVVPASPEGA